MKKLEKFLYNLGKGALPIGTSFYIHKSLNKPKQEESLRDQLKGVFYNVAMPLKDMCEGLLYGYLLGGSYLSAVMGLSATLISNGILMISSIFYNTQIKKS